MVILHIMSNIYNHFSKLTDERKMIEKLLNDEIVHLLAKDSILHPF
jgi:hypothetical protein